MVGHGERLSHRQEAAIAALLTCPSVQAAALACGLGVMTLYRWMKLEVFSVTYREARRQLVDQAVTALQAASSEAVETLRAIVRDASQPGSTRVTACRAILDLAIRATEMTEIIERVAALEKEHQR